MTSRPDSKLPETTKTAQITRAVLQTVGGAVPFAGGFLSAIAGAWSEGEQEKFNKFLEHWVQMLQDELKEKEDTILQIITRIDILDEKVAKRIESREYQSLLKKTFREWSGAESEAKREYIKNILANAAATEKSSDDVVRLFIDWINKYSEMHFQVIGAIYNNDGISRGEIWRVIGRGKVREDSADADLYKLLIRDLSTGGIIRQHREVDYRGNFLSNRRKKKVSGIIRSAFDEQEGYDLTELGKEFIHYAMTDLPLKIELKNESEDLKQY